MALQVSDSNVTTKLSTRLTEVYWEIQPMEDGEFWPFADVEGTEYILFTSRDGSIAYYKEGEGVKNYSRHSLGLNGTITSMGAVPLAKNGIYESYEGLVFVCIKYRDGGSQICRINIVGGTLKYSLIDNPIGYKAVRVAGGVCTAAGKGSVLGLYKSKDQGKGSMGVYQWIYQMGEEQEYWSWYDWKKFELNPIGPAIVPDNYMQAFLFCPNTNYEKHMKSFKASGIKAGHRGTIYWPIPDAMYPAKLIQAEQVNLTALDSYTFMLIEQDGKRSLWVSKVENYAPKQFQPLPISDEIKLKSFSVQGVRRNNRDTVSITATDCNNPKMIFHSFCDPLNPGELNMLPIANDALSYQDCVNAQYEHLLYYVSQDKKTEPKELRRLCYDSVDDEWEEELVAGEKKTEYRAVPVYEHRLHVTDASGMPVSGASVKVSTETHMILESGGQFIPVDKGKPKILKTDVTGCLAVYHETHSLSDGDIHMELSTCREQGSLVSSPAEMQRKHFEKLNRADLQNAKDPDGKYVLTPEQRKDTSTLDNICLSVRDIAGSRGTDQCFASGCKAFCLEKQEDGSVKRKELTIEELEAVKQDILRDTGFWSDVADFFRGIARGIVKVVTTVVEVVKEAIRTTVEFIANSVKKAVRFVADTVHHVVDTIETVLGMVLKAFEPLFSWIGELIGINSIIRTQKAVKFLCKESIPLIKNSADEGVRFLRKHAAEVSWKLDQSLDYVCKSLGRATPAAYKNHAEKIAGPYSGAADNYVIDILKRQVTEVVIFPEDFYEPLQGVAEELLAYLQTISRRVENEPDFKEAEQYLIKLTKSHGDFMCNSIAAFLKGLAGVLKLVLSMLVDFCERVVRLGLRCLDAFWSIVEQKIWIPALGTLFKMVFRQDLTLLNLASLIIAMPAHAVMKATKDQVPFENDNALAKFEEECHRALNLQDHVSTPVSGVTKDVLMTISCTSQIAVYICVGISDGISKPTEDVPDNSLVITWSTVFDGVAIFGNFCWIVCSCPTHFDDNPSVGAYGVWVVCIINLLIDVALIIRALDNKSGFVDSAVAVVGFIMGLAYTIFDICNWVAKGIGDIVYFINEIFICIQSIGRICMLPALVNGSKGISKAIECGLDFLTAVMGLAALVYYWVEKVTVERKALNDDQVYLY